MLFNSFTFIIFFAVVTILYFILPHKFRWVILLISSYMFYMAWRPELILLIVFSTFVNYIISLLIYREKEQKYKKRYLIISLIINFGLLFIFKYLVFINQTFISLFSNIGLNYPIREFDIILPMGISFYTFQAASYTIDVYKGDIKPVRHYGIFSLFITFFPQLVAGPIERSGNLLPQFYVKHKFNLERCVEGLKIMLFGYFKKIVIADRVAVAVNTIYNSPQNYDGLYFVIASVLFAFQIYCDFSGYSDIAMGSAKVLGFDLMTNFEKPYFSKSIKEFWRRWHVSLSTWFMDYVYIPLGGSRNGKFKHYRNLLVTFLISGLWHGSNWTFVLWGGIHGVYQVIGLITLGFRNKIKSTLRLESSYTMTIISTFITFVLVCFAWIFFRANTASDALYIAGNLFAGIKNWTNSQYLYEVITGLGINLYELKVVVVSIIVLMSAELISGKENIHLFLKKKMFVFRLGFYVLIATIVMTTGVYYDAGAFIYFQF